MMTITLAWDPPTDITPTEYLVHEIGPGGDPVEVARTTSTTATLSGVSVARHQYYVVARNPLGLSLPSNLVETGGASQAPQNLRIASITITPP